MESDTNSETGSAESSKVENSLVFLATSLKMYPDALTKSQIPEAKKKKEAALESIKNMYECNFGHPISTAQMMKKINNMKSRLKKKVDKNQTGNKPIILNSWEKELYGLLEGDTNPTISRITGTLNGIVVHTETFIFLHILI